MCPLALLSASVAAWFPLPLQVKSASVGGAAVRPFVLRTFRMFKATGLVVAEEKRRQWRCGEREREREGRSEMCGNLHFGGRTGRKEASMQRGRRILPCYRICVGFYGQLIYTDTSLWALLSNNIRV